LPGARLDLKEFKKKAAQLKQQNASKATTSGS
jgi:hypothetical protein